MTRLKPDVRDIDPVNFKFQPMFHLSTRSLSGTRSRYVAQHW